MNDRLLVLFSEDEIVKAFNSMSPLRAPSIDGFNTLFYQKFQSIIGSDVIDICLSVFNRFVKFSIINKTHIVLISKIKRQKYDPFQAYQLCTMLYKIILKVVVNRMSSLLDDCIDKAQGTFIPNWLIFYNTPIAYEVLHLLKMKKQGKEGNFPLKLDMSKV